MFLGVDFLKYLDIEAPCLQPVTKIVEKLVMKLCVGRIKINMAKCS